MWVLRLHAWDGAGLTSICTRKVLLHLAFVWLLTPPCLSPQCDGAGNAQQALVLREPQPSCSLLPECCGSPWPPGYALQARRQHINNLVLLLRHYAATGQWRSLAGVVTTLLASDVSVCGSECPGTRMPTALLLRSCYHGVAMLPC